MASSQVDVVNNALMRLGDKLISSMSENNDRARFMSQIYQGTLDARIRMHNWNCFTRRAALSELADSPAFGWDHMFQLPQDPFCLLVLTVNEDGTEQDSFLKWQVETYATASATYRVLLTDETSVNLKYLARITDVLQWDSLFADAMSADLAYQACMPLTGSQNLKALLQREAQEGWRLAKSRDGQEGRPLKKVLSDSLTVVRL